MNKWILAMLLIAANGITQAQKVDIAWGAPSYTERVAGVNEQENILVIKDSDYGITNKGNTYNKRYIHTKNHLYGIIEDTKQKTVSFQEFSKRAGKPIGTPTQIDTKLILDFITPKNDIRYLSDLSMLTTPVSSNGTKFIYSEIVSNFQSNSIIMDEDLNKLWTSNKNFSSSIITNEGKVITAQIRRKLDSGKNEKSLSAYITVDYKNSSEQKEIVLPGNKYITSISAKDIGNNKIVFSGIYTAWDKKTPADSDYGITIGVFDIAKMEIESIKQTPFDYKVIQNSATDKHTLTLQKLESGDILSLDDNEYAFVIEEKEAVIYDGQLKAQSGEKIIIYFNQNLTIDKQVCLPILQHKSDTYSYDTKAFKVLDNKVLLVYNVGERGSYRMKATIIDEYGKVELDQELDINLDGKDSYRFYPLFTQQIEPNKIMVCAIVGTHEIRSYGILTIKR